MGVCKEHLSGDEHRPCAWVGCPNGTNEDQIPESIRDDSRIYVRSFVDSFDRRRRYFWRDARYPWWLASTQLRNHEFARAHRPLYTSPNVYHYTTLLAFQKIIESQELWLSDYAYLNDSSEIRHGLEVATGVFSDVLTSLAPDEKALFDPLINLPTTEQPRICVACFSFERDSLSQWRGYGASTLPIAIGVEPFDFFFGLGPPFEVHPTPVIYDPDVKRDLLRGLVHDWAALYRLDRDYPDAHWISGYDQLVKSHFFELVSMFKHESFRDEREFRYVYREDPNRFGADMLPAAPKHFRVAGPLIIPYTTTRDLARSFVESWPARESRLRISDVVLGPHPLADVAHSGVREFLDAHGYEDVPVSRSKVPFR